MTRPTEALLSSENLLHNVQWIRSKIGSSKIIAMVKANAYGHGIRSISRHIADHVDMFGVASMDEAATLRSIGIGTPIMLAEGVFNASEWSIAAHNDCQVVIHTAEQIRMLDHLTFSHPIKVWLKINTGMGRLGFHPNEIPEIYALLSQDERFQHPIGLMSHFASSETDGCPKTAQQSGKFQDIIASIPEFSGPITLCNSGGVLNRYQDHFDYVRPGLLLYGVSPKADTTGQSLGLRPVMTLRTQLISVFRAQKGDEIGYGGHFRCPEAMDIGIAAIGYGDGYPFSARSGTPLLVNDRLCALAGRVSMDMIAIDLRQCPSAKFGDTVTLWGPDLPIETIVPFTQEISYTLLTGLHHRVNCRWS
jgi:alanine racemase